MNTVKKTRVTALALFSVLAALVLAAIFVFSGAAVYAAEDKNVTEMTGTGFSAAEENGVTVWTASEKTEKQTLAPEDNKLGEYNTVKFSVRTNKYGTDNGTERSLALVVKSASSGAEVFFEVMPHYAAARLRSGKTALSAKNYSNVGARRWHTAECTIDRNVITFVFDELTVTGASPFVLSADDEFRFEATGMAPSIKDVTLSSKQTEQGPVTCIGFEERDEDGETVYAATDSGDDLKGLYINEDIGSDNRITLDMRFGGDNLGDEWANVRMYVSTGVEDEYIAFQFIPYWKAVVIERWVGGENAGRLAEGNFNVASSLATDWFSFSVMLSGGYVGISCGDDIVAECLIDEKYDFTNAELRFSSFRLKCAMKNIAHSQAGEIDLPEWIGSGFTNSMGEYTAKGDGGLKRLYRTRKTTTENAVTFELRPNSYQPESDGNAGFAVNANDGSGVYMFFELMPKISQARVRLIYGNNGNQIGMTPYSGGGSYDEWLRIKCVFDTDLVLFYVNDKLVVSAFDTRGFSFAETDCFFNVWKTGASFRNAVFSHEEIDGGSLAAMGYMDLDFNDEKSLFALRSENASITYDGEKQAAECAATANDPSLSVDVKQNPGGKYSAYLPVRNTVFTVIKNGTSASALNLTFTAGDKGAEKEYSKDFAISKGDDFIAYYFNVSDLNPAGYLKNFTFTLKGGLADETFSVKRISFEREAPIYDYAADGAVRCVADRDGGTVTVSGRLKAAYAGRTVSVVTSSVMNYEENLSGKLVGENKSNADGSFSVAFPLLQGSSNKLTHLGSFFLAYVRDGSENVKLSRPFNIENYEDFAELKSPVDIPTLSVKATDAPFNAKGDAYTDDTDAIQAAVDHVAAQGGGKVIVPGDVAAEYGRRYIVTNIKLKDNIDLCIEKGAVLWQSSRKADYKYKPSYGHDALSDAMWAHCGVCSNYPIVEIKECKNVRVSGGGEIRMMDAGSEWLDGSVGYEAKDGHEIIIGCESRIHVTAIGMSGSHGVEITDLKVTRGGNWHVVMVHCTDLLIKNVHINEAVCRNTDGYSFQDTQHATLFRCSLVSNDDAIVLLPCYSDLRDKPDWWWERKRGGDNSVSDILFVGNNLHGGLGFVFIPWGSGDPDLSNAEVRDLEGYDNIFDGYQSIGCWADNPNYGISKGAAYTGTWGEPNETDDYSPIKNIYLHDNYFPNGFHDISWIANYEKLRAYATNFVNDAGVVGATDFLNASFERELRYDNEVDWVSGLSYWSSDTSGGGETGYEQVGKKNKTASYTGNPFEVKDYAGYVAGNARLYQGINLDAGAHRLNISVKNPHGVGYFFAGDPITGEIYTEVKLGISEDFAEREIFFSVPRASVVAVGVIGRGTNEQKVWIDDASVSVYGGSIAAAGEKLAYNFNDGTVNFISYPADGASVQKNKLVTSDDGEYALMLNNKGALTELDMSVDITFGEGLCAGMFVLASLDTDYAITGINVRITASGGDAYKVSAIKYTSGKTETLCEKDMPREGAYLTMRVTVNSGMLNVYIDDATAPTLTADVTGLSGNAGLFSSHCRATFDNFTFLSGQYESGTPVLTDKPQPSEPEKPDPPDPQKPGAPEQPADDGVNLGLAVGLPVALVAAAAIAVAVVLVVRKKKRK